MFEEYQSFDGSPHARNLTGELELPRPHTPTVWSEPIISETAGFYRNWKFDLLKRVSGTFIFLLLSAYKEQLKGQGKGSSLWCWMIPNTPGHQCQWTSGLCAADRHTAGSELHLTV